MIEARPYAREKERLASLKALRLLDMPIEERFERVTRMVCKFLDVPIALFNLIDDNRQHFKSVRGLNNTDAPLEAAFCTHALHEDEMLLVPDATKDQRFFDNPFVNGKLLNIRFYAGCPIRTPDGMPVGTLCAIDTKPRELTDDQLALLHDLSAIVETELKVSSLTKAQAELAGELSEAKHLALVDPLTRLWNRSGIEKLLAKECDEAFRNNKPVTVVMGDVDHFKRINEGFGHPAGDTVLKTISKKILEALRGEDDAGRLGGEEFLMILTDCAPEKVFEAVERIRLSVQKKPIDLGEIQHGNTKIIQSLPVTMSFGAATAMPGAKIDTPELIKRADRALYKARESGRNKVVVA
ncbi:MAG: hypothetical protein JWO78_1032 [Micavibrio sp.]|nr:hypothetical protein [Micavibrio sp.]